MAWKLKLYFSDGTDEEVLDDFDSEEEAMREYEDWLEGWSAGAEVLELAGREYSTATIVDYEIWEE